MDPNGDETMPATLELTAARLAAEIIAAVVADRDLPDEWESIACYAEIGEPTAYEVRRLVREELAGTGIRP
jgi:hypothetical protein